MDKRLDSLDALRGFDMFFITGGSALLAALGTLITGDARSWIAVQMTHATWTEPLRIYDFIFPLFLFIAGVTFPFSTEKRLARGDSTRAITLNIIRRTATLVVLGLLFEQVQKSPLIDSSYRRCSVRSCSRTFLAASFATATSA